MASDYAVDRDALTKASSQIAGCVGPVKRIDLGGLSGDGQWYGHPDLHGAVTEFCNTWQRAIASLAERSEVAGDQLKVAAQRYGQADESGSRAMGHIGHGLPPP